MQKARVTATSQHFLLPIFRSLQVATVGLASSPEEPRRKTTPPSLSIKEQRHTVDYRVHARVSRAVMDGSSERSDRVKFLVAGDAGVGKSTLIHALCGGGASGASGGDRRTVGCRVSVRVQPDGVVEEFYDVCGANFDLETSHVVPALIRKCIEAKASGADHIIGWGDGSPTREFLYVEDAAEGILLATEKYNGSEPINIGSSFEISIKDIMETIVRLVEFKGEIRWDTSRPNGQPRRKLDVTRAKELFGFESQTPFEVGLKKVIDWYVANS